MKSSAKSDEYATFEGALKKVLQVSHTELQRRIKNYQPNKKRAKAMAALKRKQAAVGRASVES